MHTLDQDNHIESLVGFKSSTDLYILYVYVNTNTYTPFSNHFIMFSRYGMDVLNQIFSQAVCFFPSSHHIWGCFQKLAAKKTQMSLSPSNTKGSTIPMDAGSPLAARRNTNGSVVRVASIGKLRGPRHGTTRSQTWRKVVELVWLLKSWFVEKMIIKCLGVLSLGLRDD